MEPGTSTVQMIGYSWISLELFFGLLCSIVSVKWFLRESERKKQKERKREPTYSADCGLEHTAAQASILQIRIHTPYLPTKAKNGFK